MNDARWKYECSIGFTFRASGLDVASRIHRAMCDAAQKAAQEAGADPTIEVSRVWGSAENFATKKTESYADRHRGFGSNVKPVRQR